MSSDGYRLEIERDESGKAVRLNFFREPVDTVAAESCACKRASCGRPVPPQVLRRGEKRVYCSDRCRRADWEEKHPRIGRQAALAFDPAPAPLPPVRDQRVPRPECRPLQRMSRLILERLRRGPATASELQAMFPGARSVRTRISDVNLWLQTHEQQRVVGEPVRGVVGEWHYTIEDNG